MRRFFAVLGSLGLLSILLPGEASAGVLSLSSPVPLTGIKVNGTAYPGTNHDRIAHEALGL